MENQLDPTGPTPAAAPQIPAGDPAPPPAPSYDAEPALVSPEIERLGTPDGAAKYIVEPDGTKRPSAVFLAVVSVVSFVSDIGSKIWAEHRLEGYPGTITLNEKHLSLVLAKNRGGAWGLLQGAPENVRLPFFLLVSVAAIAFIVTLYRRLLPRQRALKWGLPLVLGGALGNVFDRIRYGYVIDFIDFRAEWIHKGNELLAKRVPGHVVTDHWPTFNIADVAICVGVGLMAVDMFFTKKKSDGRTIPPPSGRTSLPPDPIPAPPAIPAPDAIAGTKPVE